MVLELDYAQPLLVKSASTGDDIIPHLGIDTLQDFGLSSPPKKQA